MRFFSRQHVLTTFVLPFLAFFALSFIGVVSLPQSAQAQSCNLCATVGIPFGGKICVCVPSGTHGGRCDCSGAFKNACMNAVTPDCMGHLGGQANPAGIVLQTALGYMHLGLRTAFINTVFRNNFKDYRRWFSRDFFDKTIIKGFRKIGNDMSVTAMHQAYTIGTLYDAKQHVEVQRMFQELENEALRDYQPSESLCTFGTAVRSLASSESRARHTSLAMNAVSMARHLGKLGVASRTRKADKTARWKQFKNTYCDPQDNNWTEIRDDSGNLMPAGLALACGANGGGETERLNIDIDYGRLIEQKRTLNVAFDNYAGIDDPNPDAPAGAKIPPPDRADVLALSRNLYGHDVLSRDLNDTTLKNRDFQDVIMALRTVAAKRNVAENSFNAIVQLKAAGSADTDTPHSVRDHLGAILVEIGVPDDQLDDYIGENPSYYAQLEVLAKKIYQNPAFFSELYESPANIERKSIMLKAIELMLDRAIYESELRQEMVSSVLLSSEVEKEFETVRSTLLRQGGS